MGNRRLILMRHATAAPGSGRDFDRPLTHTGREEARRVGERLRRLGQAPTRVIGSSARRCQETWAAVCAGLGPDGPDASAVDPDPALYDASPRELLAAIRDVDDGLDATLLVVAHNPGISLLALELGRAEPKDEDQLRNGFAPATVAVFAVECPWSELAADTARLLRFERPPRADGETD